MRKLFNGLGTTIIVLLIIVVLPLTLPRLFGFQMYRVLSGSMEPEIPINSVIYVRETEPDRLTEGDVITFQLGSNTDLVETHRVISIDTGNELITTQGDANESVDQTKVRFANVLGRVAFHVPLLGIVSEFIRTPQGIAACVAVFAAVLLMWLIADRLKPKERTS